MWKKNFLFLAVSLAGLLFLLSWILPKHRLSSPAEFDANWVENAGAAETLRQLNEEFQASWDEDELQVAPRADDLTVARRLSLALIGTIPSLEELREFEKQPEDERINWWISHLLEDERSADYLAERLARSYVGVEDGPFIVFRRRRFVSWLSDRLESRQPYNQLVSDLLTEEGLWTDTPAVNFVSVTADPDNDNQPDPIRLAGRTSRAFIGMRIDCLQCHDDNLGTIELGAEDDLHEGTQQDFHQLAAFFSDVVANGRGIRDAVQTQPYEYRYLDASEDEVVPPSVPYRPDLLPEHGSRRERLAAWLTHQENRPFARAIVNRTWAILFGRPLQEPVDNLPLNGPFAPGLERLADDFIEHDYNLQRLIRLIALAEPFQRDSRAGFMIREEDEASFAVFRPVRLRPEQVAGSIIQATSLSAIDAESNVLVRLIRFGEESDFVTRYGDRGEDEFQESAATIPQQLVLMNGKLVHEHDQANDLLLNSLSQIARLSGDAEAIVGNAYLTVLTRQPSQREVDYFAERFVGVDSDTKSRELEDLFWVLFKSPDFMWNR